MERLLSYNPHARITRTFHHNIDDPIATIETKQDVTEIAEAAKARYNSIDEKARWDDDYNHVASIPMSIYFDLQKQGILDDDKAFRRWLNDPDNRVFRTRPGRI